METAGKDEVEDKRQKVENKKADKIWKERKVCGLGVRYEWQHLGDLFFRF